MPLVAMMLAPPPSLVEFLLTLSLSQLLPSQGGQGWCITGTICPNMPMPCWKLSALLVSKQELLDYLHVVTKNQSEKVMSLAVPDTDTGIGKKTREERGRRGERGWRRG